MRSAGLGWVALVVAPIPIAIALIVTAKPVYSPDACYYGATAADVALTDHYLGIMAPLGMLGLAAVATLAIRSRTRDWAAIGAGLVMWAVLCVLWYEASYPVMYPGGLLALFGIFFGPLALALAAAAGHSTGAWLTALASFEAIFLLPALLGLAKILAQPSCIS